MKELEFNITIPINRFIKFKRFLNTYSGLILIIILCIISVVSFLYYQNNGLGLAYNDARSHLNIGRRVVEGLKPGIAQIGSVWLPLLHVLMIPTIWNDFMWQTGLAGSIISMISFVITGWFIYKFLEIINVGFLGRIVGVFIFAFNLNILYLQSTAMTESLLLMTMTAGVYELTLWSQNNNYLNLIKSAFWICLATLTRYDGWFLLAWASVFIILITFKNKGYRVTEGVFLVFGTLAGIGVLLWFSWNQIIFDNALYFISGPFSAKAQQDLLSDAGVLATKYNLSLSIKTYLYALMYNSGVITVIVGFLGVTFLWFEKRLSKSVKLAITILLAPLFFNILALFIGHSVLYVAGISGNTWFNVRYGITLLPSIAFFGGYLVDKLSNMRVILASILFFLTIYSLISGDAVTIDDARVGSSQKNVTEVSDWLSKNASKSDEFILISAASHDAIIFSSRLPMKRFIHEGTGLYWENASNMPDRWARWIIMRSNDNTDLTWRLVSKSSGINDYILIHSFPFADIYELKPELLNQLQANTTLYN